METRRRRESWNMEKHLTFALSPGLARSAITQNGNCRGI